MGQLKYLVIHCTATPEGRDVTKDDILQWHMAPKPDGNGWSRPGYADMIGLKGELVNITPFNFDDFVDRWELTYGAKGLNGNARHVVYVGGMDKDNNEAKDTRTPEQLYTLEVYVKHTILRHPKIKVLGHYQSPNAGGKTCPNFDVIQWLENIGISEENIFKAA